MPELEPRADEPNAGSAPGAAPGFRLLPSNGRLPVVTLLFIAANLAMAGAEFVLCGFRWGDAVRAHAAEFALGEKVASLIAHGEYWRLVTASFLHANVLHLAGNMLALFVLGRWIETLYGRSRTFVIFMLACVGGMLASYKLTVAPSVGASTGVYGLLGALLAHNLRYQRYLPLRMARRTSWMLFFLGFLMLFETMQPTVDSFGHFGGLLAGMAMGFLLSGRIAGAEQRNRDWLPLPTGVATAAALLAYGLFGLATALPSERGLLQAARARTPDAQIAGMDRAVRHHPYFLEARLELFDLLRSAHRTADAAAVLEATPLAPNGEAAGATSGELALILYFRSVNAARKEQWEPAVEYARLGLRAARDPDLRAELDNQVAWILADSLHRDLDEAERDAREGVRLAPETAAIADTLAWVLYQEGKYEEALKEQQVAINLDRNGSPLTELARKMDLASETQRAELYYHLGAIQEKLGHLPEAVAAYTRAARGIGANRKAIEALQRLRGNPAPAGSASRTARRRLLG